MKQPENITCETANTWIDLAVTGDLPVDEKKLLDVHCVRCASCARRLATRRTIWEHYPCGISPSEELISRTVASLRKPAPAAIREPFIRRLPAMAAVAAVIMLAFALVLNFAGRRPRETRDDQFAILRQVLESVNDRTPRTVFINVDKNGEIQLRVVHTLVPSPESRDPQFVNWVY